MISLVRWRGVGGEAPLGLALIMAPCAVPGASLMASPRAGPTGSVKTCPCHKESSKLELVAPFVHILKNYLQIICYSPFFYVCVLVSKYPSYQKP